MAKKKIFQDKSPENPSETIEKTEKKDSKVKKTMEDFFLELSGVTNDNSEGRFVLDTEFIGEYSFLAHNNGGGWSRADGPFCKKWKLLAIRKNYRPKYCWNIDEGDEEEVRQLKSRLLDEWSLFAEEKNIGQERGEKIIAYKICGKNNDGTGSNSIRSDIWNFYKIQRCLLLDTTNPEVDHKNGRKNNPLVMNQETQSLEDFQPLSKAANDAKRQHCKECKETGRRYDARRMLGNRKGWYAGGETFGDPDNPNGCLGCFWYDVKAYREHTSLPDIEDL